MFGKKRGSLLLEIAVALSILGVVSGFLITKGIVANRAIRMQTTKNNIEYVKTALAAYLANYYRLPRPSHDASGLEITAATRLADFVGTIPYSTLGIAKKYTLDGNAKPLIYIVEPMLTANFEGIYDNTITDANFCRGIANASIVIQGIRNSLPNIVAFVIDTKTPQIANQIIVQPSADTNWISRDLFLIQYLKNAPCKREGAPIEIGVARDDFSF